ncbi:Uncharacterised protein [Raoultella ornithinolytica]|nr:Uncharacterised protein [Raoultella ornithinolytica]
MHYPQNLVFGTGDLRRVARHQPAHRMGDDNDFFLPGGKGHAVAAVIFIEIDRPVDKGDQSFRRGFIVLQPVIAINVNRE